MKNTDDFLLTQTITVGQAKQWITDKDDQAKEALTNFIYHRFYNRYIKHVKSMDSGFLKMAVCCLMIETIESFKQGKKNTKPTGMGKKMFEDFFKSEKSNFPEFESIYKEFYYNIRCGILHQAETTNGWRILRSGKILDKTNKTINSEMFVKALEKSLQDYKTVLDNSTFTEVIWQNAVKKIKYICENCKVSS
ncbi:hypothetical protein [Flavobacterium aquidurense]|uniref:hypothetical protein n=1 Tax=Flavobacterium aquidurense TaxID=362413 RepID=UPI002855389E|nr:hypothetical protein [Flavobacterium aquidurense]MDR7371081.1 protein-arginine kinase activator protein McsA [Flavobacterium aquidurense]